MALGCSGHLRRGRRLAAGDLRTLDMAGGGWARYADGRRDDGGQQFLGANRPRSLHGHEQLLRASGLDCRAHPGVHFEEISMTAKHRLIRYLLLCSVTITACNAGAQDAATSALPLVGVGAQYDTTHVYVAPGDVDRFAASFLATFGGQSTQQVVATVTPTASSTTSQLLQTPVGTVSLFGFSTPIPYPFGAERTGYLVTDMDTAIRLAKAAGADVLVATFPDPIGVDAVIQWP